MTEETDAIAAEEAVIEAELVALEDVAKQAQSQISKVRKDLKAEGNGYQLTHVNMDLKMLAAGDGTKMKFVDPAAGHAPETLSKVEFKFAPAEADRSGSVNRSVPNLISYTELLARRKARNTGFTIDIRYQAVSDPEEASRVVTQLPIAGTSQAPLSPIVVFIGKLIQT